MPLSTAIASMSATNGVAYTNEFQQTQFALHGITSRTPGTSQILSLMKFVDLLHDSPSSSSSSLSPLSISPQGALSQPLSSPRRLFLNAIGKSNALPAIQRSPSNDGTRLRLMLPRAALGSPHNSSIPPTGLLHSGTYTIFV